MVAVLFVRMFVCVLYTPAPALSSRLPGPFRSKQVVLSWDGLDVEELLRTDKLEQNVFHYAAACGDTRMLSLLLARLEMGRTKPPELMRALNKASASGWTPLSCAVVHARTSAVHLLVEHGAIVDPSVQEAAQKCAAQQRAAATDEVGCNGFPTRNRMVEWRYLPFVFSTHQPQGVIMD